MPSAGEEYSRTIRFEENDTISSNDTDAGRCVAGSGAYTSVPEGRSRSLWLKFSSS